MKTYAADIKTTARKFRAATDDYRYLDIDTLDTTVTIRGVPGLAETHINFCSATITDSMYFYSMTQTAINAPVNVRQLVEKKFGKVVEWTEVCGG